MRSYRQPAGGRGFRSGQLAGGGSAGPWPGFAIVAPPKVATASALGASPLGARGDHTHGLDLVAYVPSLAGMQAGGLIQQTYGAPTATPAVLTMVAAQVPFGAASGGTLAQSANFTYTDAATGGLRLSQSNSVPATPILSMVSTDLTGPLLTFRMTLPGTAGQSEFAVWETYSGATLNSQMLFVRGASGTTHGGIIMAPGTDVNQRDSFAIESNAQSSVAIFCTQLADVAIGRMLTQQTNATSGFVWISCAAGAPTGSPSLDNNNGAITGSRRAIQLDNTNNRFYSFLQGAWHFTSFDDYSATATRVPFGAATAGTLTDTANLTFVVGTGVLHSPLLESNTLGGFGGGLTLSLENNHAAPTTTLSLIAAGFDVTGSLSWRHATGILQSPLVETNTVGGFGGGGVLTLENNHAAPSTTLSLNGSTTATLTGDLVSDSSATRDLGKVANLWNHVWGATMHAVNYQGFVGATPIGFTDNAGNLAMQFAAGAITMHGTAWGVFGQNAAQPTITGSRSASGPWAQLLTALAAYGLIVDATTP